MLAVLFWVAFLLTVYTYVGYALLLWILSKFQPKPVACGAFEPTVSIVIAARNEEKILSRKLENLYGLDYPADRIQIIVASDGSTDATNQILLAHKERVIPVLLGAAHGKAHALNEAVKHATGEVVVFLDVRQTVDFRSVSHLVKSFADPLVGAVSGELVLESGDGRGGSEGLGIYWKIEKFVRRMESATGSVIGVTGAIYAVRRELYTSIPAGTILDDVFVPMHVGLKGKRVVFEPLATATDYIFAEKGKEFSRKVRTLTGNYQLLLLEPWLLSLRNPLLFRFVCHKLLRLLMPQLLLTMLLASAAANGVLYRGLFGAQLGLYLLAILGLIVPRTRRFKLVSIPNTFLMLNAAAALAFYNFVLGRQKVWVK